MKKTTQKMKALMLTLAMAIGLLLPMTTNAQNGGTDGFFGKAGDENNDRVSGTNGLTMQGMTPQGTDSQAPLGSGLLVMVAVGAGYAILKKKEEAK